jgi:hypothetical protein
VIRLLRLLALAAAAFALTLGFAELLVRTFLPQNLVLIRGDVWLPHERYAWTTAPNLDVAMSAGESRVRFKTDAEGNRIGDGVLPEATFRILALGIPSFRP